MSWWENRWREFLEGLRGGSDPVEEEKQRAEKRSVRQQAKDAARKLYEDKMEEALRGLDPNSEQYKRTRVSWLRLIEEEMKK